MNKNSSSPRVLLINPNRIRPVVAPIALEYINAFLENFGIETEVLDLCFEPDPKLVIRAVLSSSRFTCIGITIRNTDNSCYPGSEFFLPEIKDLISYIRVFSIDTPIVLGGAGFSAMPVEVIKYCKADYGIPGANLLSFVKLIRNLGSNMFSDIPGVIFRKNNKIHFGKPVKSNCRVFKLDRNLEMNNKYYIEGGIAGIETKCGCSYSCIYCVDPISKGRKINYRDITQIGNEFQKMKEGGITRFHICDSEFNAPQTHAIEVCKEIIRRKLHGSIGWYCYLTPAEVSKELVFWLKKAGCQGVVFCTEHCNDTILRVLNKGFCFDDIKRAARLCQDYKLPQLHSILLGAPGESRDTARECIDRMKYLNSSIVKVSTGIRVYPNTQIAYMVKNQHLPVISSNGCIKELDNLLEPTFYISESIINDYEFDSHIKQCINNDERFLCFEFRDSAVKPTYYYDWMKLLAGGKKSQTVLL